MCRLQYEMKPRNESFELRYLQNLLQWRNKHGFIKYVESSTRLPKTILIFFPQVLFEQKKKMFLTQSHKWNNKNSVYYTFGRTQLYFA